MGTIHGTEGRFCKHSGESGDDDINVYYRQIRNAFQTSIALVEHQAIHNGPDAPKPVLGKEQFKIVAEGSKEFDKYLMSTLQGADDDIAIRDQWRDDRFDGAMSVSARQAPRSSSKRDKAVLKDENLSETESSSESESESGEEDSDSSSGGRKASRGAVSASEKGKTKEIRDEKTEMEDYAEFLKFKAMMKARGK